MHKNILKNCQDSFRLFILHFCPVTTLANSSCSFADFLFHRKKGTPDFSLPQNSRKKQHFSRERDFAFQIEKVLLQFIQNWIILFRLLLHLEEDRQAKFLDFF